MLTRRMHWLARFVLTLALVGAVGLAVPTTSLAADCQSTSIGADGALHYDAKECGSGKTGPAPGQSGPQENTCGANELGYCIGAAACYTSFPAYKEPPAGETGPTPESIYYYQQCWPETPGLTGYFWTEPAGPSVEDLARQAYGALVTPAFSLGFNPPTRTIVGVPTWFWARGAGTAEIVGTSALNLVAYGTPKSMEVDPGDGSGVMTCPWSATRSDVCASTYRRSSAGETGKAGNLPAYTARARLVYDVRFENNGAAITVPGMPATLESPWQTVAIPVAEVQSLVTTGS